MLDFNLTPIFKARGIEKPFAFLTNAGFSNYSAHTILNSYGKSFRLDHVELLCKVLVCEPGDLLRWTPDKHDRLATNHPLYKLQQNDVENWQDTFANMPFQELKALSKQMNSGQ